MNIKASSVLGFFSLGVVAFDSANEILFKWAIGIIAFLMGYWLK